MRHDEHSLDENINLLESLVGDRAWRAHPLLAGADVTAYDDAAQLNQEHGRVLAAGFECSTYIEDDGTRMLAVRMSDSEARYPSSPLPDPDPKWFRFGAGSPFAGIKP